MAGGPPVDARGPGEMRRNPFMSGNLYLTIVAILLLFPGQAARAQETSVRAKQFPPGYFYPQLKAPVAEKQQVLEKLAATLTRLNRDGYDLVAKGAVLDRQDTTRKIYGRLAILDESGLIIVARNVPNLYYLYPNPAAINPNIYLIIKNPRVNVEDSFIRYSIVVEGDYVAYVHKFVAAIMETLEGPGARGEPRPEGQNLPRRPPQPTPQAP